ncbi:MAG TPA: citrate synthase [Holophaga sp.]|nr:citrate synthase [Holophaga sp.]
MTHTAKLELDGKIYELPIIEGTEDEKAVDVRDLRAKSGYITYDESYANTGSCQSKITFIDGEKGILRYRGIPIEELAEGSTFVQAAYLIIFGKLPTETERLKFSGLLTKYQMIHEDMKFHFEGFPSSAHPMAILSAMINAAGCFLPQLNTEYDPERFEIQAAHLLSQVRTLAAYAYRKSRGLPSIYPKKKYMFTENFLHMMFSEPDEDYELDPAVVDALDLIFLLHADHEQNCSTATVRMVASSRANLFASASAGVCALWGPLHGGANQAVIEMLHEIRATKDDGTHFLDRVKNKGQGAKLMGFGHRVYKNYDPRARIIKRKCDELLNKMGISDPLLDIAKKLEETALNDPYFIERRLYPNVDFYSGIIMQAIGIPVEMFTVIFAIGRMPGWIANYKEVAESSDSRIYRPRQIYQGNKLNHYVPLFER